MNTPHKKAKEIIHWANGGEIQWGYIPADGDGECNEWHDFRIFDKTTDFNDPQVCLRIKPKPVKLRYRVALMENEGGNPRLRVVTTNDQQRSIKVCTSYGVFIEWLTDWIEVEV